MLHISPSCILSLQSTTSGSDEGGSLDFMAPGAVSQLMSLLESQVSTLDEHLEWVSVWNTRSLYNLFVCMDRKEKSVCDGVQEVVLQLSLIDHSNITHYLQHSLTHSGH